MWKYFPVNILQQNKQNFILVLLILFFLKLSWQFLYTVLWKYLAPFPPAFPPLRPGIAISDIVFENLSGYKNEGKSLWSTRFRTSLLVFFYSP